MARDFFDKWLIDVDAQFAGKGHEVRVLADNYTTH